MHQNYLKPRSDFAYLRYLCIIAPVIVFTSAYVTVQGLTIATRNAFHRNTPVVNKVSVSDICTNIMSTYMTGMQATVVPPVMVADSVEEVEKVTAKCNNSAVGIKFHQTDMDALTRVLSATPKQVPESLVEVVKFNMPATGTIYAQDVWDVTGASSMCFTFMGWQMITNSRSPQYKWRAELFPDWDATLGSSAAFDEEGFGVVDGRYVVATSASADGGLASVGQCLDVVLTDGTVIPCIVGDIKSCKDSNWTVFGHMASANSICIIEFIVDKTTWYGTGHANPGRPSCKPEWSGALDHIVLY